MHTYLGESDTEWAFVIITLTIGLLLLTVGDAVITRIRVYWQARQARAQAEIDELIHELCGEREFDIFSDD